MDVRLYYNGDKIETAGAKSAATMKALPLKVHEDQWNGTPKPCHGGIYIGWGGTSGFIAAGEDGYKNIISWSPERWCTSMGC